VQWTIECSWGTPCREPAPSASQASGPERDFFVIRGRCYRSECTRGCLSGRRGLQTSRPLEQTVLVSSSDQSFVTETGALAGPALLVHGGAGTFERLRNGALRARLESGLASALEAGWDVLQRGGDALHATVEAVARLEDSGLFNAGCGSTPTTEGIIETDASVMDGASGAAGAVCAATWPANPVRAALIVATHGQGDPFFDPSRPRGPIPGVAVVATPGDGGPAWYPVLLAGAGADSVAKAAGLAKMASGTTPLANEVRPRDLTSPGTVGAVALDGSGHVAAATSTGGRPVKPPGRVGDSSIIGAGTWADDATAAVSGTGTGEAFIVAGFAHHVDWAIRGGSSLDHALTTALKGVSGRDGTGGAIAITASGQFAAIFGTPAMARGWKSASEMVVRI
jgi:L-asparaginase / beta-aspartyl-peptidase